MPQVSAKYLRRSARLAVTSSRGNLASDGKVERCHGSAVVPATSGPCRAEMPGAPTNWHGRNARTDWIVHDGTGRVVNLRAKYDVPEQDVRLKELMNDRELATREYAAILERLNG